MLVGDCGFECGRKLPKYDDLEASTGEIGVATGMEEAIVPPTPRDMGDDTLRGATFAVIEQVVGAITVVGVMSAGL